MADAAVAIANKPAWVDLGSSDAAGSRDFYSKVFGWRVEVNPDPQYGGYGLAKEARDEEDWLALATILVVLSAPLGRSVSRFCRQCRYGG